MTKNGKARKRSNLVIGMVQFLVLAAPVTAQIPCGGYEVTAIIHPPECPPFGFPPTIGRGISEPIHGGLPNVVGYYRCPGGEDQAFLWIGNEDQFITLPMPPGTILSRAFDITPDGRNIVGRFDLGGDGLGDLAFLYDYAADEFVSLGTLPRGNYSEGLAVNRHLQVTGNWGNFVNGDPATQAFLWNKGEMKDLSGDLGTLNGSAFDVSTKGEVTGWMGIAPQIDAQAYIWEDGVVTTVPPIPNGFTSSAKAINAHRQLAVGGKFNDDHPKGFISGGFLWEDGRWTDLGMLPGYDSMALTGLNDASQIVGSSRAIESSDLPDTGFIWQEGVMRNLNDLIPPDAGLWIKRAEAINEAGQITGHGIDQKGDIVALVLTPIEPPLGDLDGDCQVGAADLLILLSSWGPCDDCGNCPADLDDNCVVGAADLLILLVNWG